jgi:tetratricopeptide (TPR) repeat protein
MLKPWIVLFLLASLRSASAQDPPPIQFPPVRPASGNPAAEAAIDPVSLYRNRAEAAAAAFQAAYRAATVERNRGRGIRLFLVGLHRDPLDAAALFDMALLCEQEGRWQDALSFLGEARKRAEPDSELARAVAAETPRAELIERLQRTPEGKTRRQYDRALIALLQRSKDPFAGLAAVAELAKIDKTRWEAPALAGMLHAQTGQYAASIHDLEEAAGLADPARASRLKSAGEIATREAGFLEQVHAADLLWDARQWEPAAKAYAGAWDRSPRHADSALRAVTGYLMVDQVDPAVRLLLRLRDTEPALGAKAAAMLQALAPVSAEASQAAHPAAASGTPEPEPPARIGELVGTLTNADMELACRPDPPLVADSTHVVPLPDKELDAGNNSFTVLSTESIFQLYQAGLAPPPPVAAAATGLLQAAAAEPPEAQPAPVLESAPSGAVSIQSDPAGAQVVVDDMVKCTAPCLVTLLPGRHTLKTQSAHYREEKRIFEVVRNSPGPVIRIPLVEKLGHIYVESAIPGARVFLDGRPTDKVTPAQFQLSEGDHEVGVEVDGKLILKKVSITDNALIPLKY